MRRGSGSGSGSCLAELVAGESVLRREQDALGEHGTDNGEPVAPPEPDQSLAAHHRAEARRRRPASLASDGRNLQKQPHALERRDGGLRCSTGEGADGHVRRHRRLLLLRRQHAAVLKRQHGACLVKRGSTHVRCSRPWSLPRAAAREMACSTQNKKHTENTQICIY